MYDLFHKDIPEILCQEHPWTAMARTISYQTPLSHSMAPSVFPPTRSCFVSTPTLSGLKLPRGDEQVCTVSRLSFPYICTLVEDIGHMETNTGSSERVANHGDLICPHSSGPAAPVHA